MANDQAKQNAQRMIAGKNGVQEARMFGMPAFRAPARDAQDKGTVFAYLHDDGVLIKLGADRASSLISANDDMHTYTAKIGRVWKDWVLIDYARAEDALGSQGLLDEALSYNG